MPPRPELRPARVAAVYATRADVWTAEGARHAIVRGRALREAATEGGLAVGDWVAVAEVAPAGDGDLVIEVVLPRRTAFVRQAAGERSEPQAIAANVDRVFVVASLESELNVRAIERYLVAIRGSGAEAALVLSKADLVEERDAPLAIAQALAPTFLASARTGDGIDALRAAMPRGTTSALVGPSGVGKSALVNALLGRTAQLEGAVREHDKRGRHTTTRRDLFFVPSGGLLVDTPGMRELKPWQPEGEHDEDVDDAFEDVAELAASCRYRDCRHETEPGCAVRAAVQAGELASARLESWRKLAREREERAARQAGFAQVEAKRSVRSRTIALRRRIREKG